MTERQKPTFYTIEIAKEICDRMAGGETLKLICEDENMPSRSAVYQWTCTDKDFRDALSRAREALADMLADEIVVIADTDFSTKAKNRIDARKWFAGVIKPKTYGPRVDVSVTETINIDSARRAALERVQRSISDQLEQDKTQVIDITPTSDNSATDKQSEDCDLFE